MFSLKDKICLPLTGLIFLLLASYAYPQLFTLSTSDYYAHSARTSCQAIALDSRGAIHVAGFTRSNKFPSRNAYQPRFAGEVDAFITGLTSSGSTLLYATFLGGRGWDKAFGIAVDTEGRVITAGVTSSPDFPCRDAYQSENKGTLDAFISILSSSGSELLYSTYLGGDGDDAAFDMALGTDNSIYLSGETFSDNFPTRNSYQASKAGWEQDLFLSRFTSSGSGIFVSTYLGGRGVDFGGSMALDTAGSVFLAGSTWSADFPTFSCYLGKKKGGYDAFVSKFIPSGSALEYSTYLGGEGIDFAYDLAVDRDGGALITGFTLGEGFPEHSSLFIRRDEEGTAYLCRLSPSGSSLSFSTLWGNPGGETGLVLSLDRSENVYIAGITGEPFFPVLNPFQSRMAGNGDVFVAKISIASNSIAYSTYLGGDEMDIPRGLAVNSAGCLYLTGFTRSLDFPLQDPLPGIIPSGSDGFITGFTSSGSTLIFSTYLGGK